MKPKDPSKEDLIIETTLDIVAREGLAGLAMATISKETSLGMGTIYNYFESKEVLIDELYLKLQEKHTKRVFSEMDDNNPFMINFKLVFNAYFVDYWENDKEYRFLEQYVQSPYMSEDAQWSEEQSNGRAYKILDRGRKELLVKYVDNQILLSYMKGGVKEIVKQMKKYNLSLDQEAMNTAFELCASVVLK